MTVIIVIISAYMDDFIIIIIIISCHIGLYLLLSTYKAAGSSVLVLVVEILY
jgi:hypothetical protein